MVSVGAQAKCNLFFVGTKAKWHHPSCINLPLVLHEDKLMNEAKYGEIVSKKNTVKIYLHLLSSPGTEL